MRRQIGDALRALANLTDPPKAIHVKPVVRIHIDSGQLAQAVAHRALAQAAPPAKQMSLLERIVGHIFGWL